MEATEDLVDEPLKGLGGISESKWHSKEFKYAEGRDIGRFNRDLMVGSDQVYPGESSVASKSGGEVLNMWNGVSVRDGAAVQCAIVITRAPVSGCLLWNHVEWGEPVACMIPNSSM